MRRALLLGVVLALVLGGTAQAHRPPLTLATADHYAVQQADDTLANSLCDQSGVNPDEPCPNGYDLDPCERVSPSRATCDVSYSYPDDTWRDTIITITTTRHGLVMIHEEDATSD